MSGEVTDNPLLASDRLMGAGGGQYLTCQMADLPRLASRSAALGSGDSANIFQYYANQSRLYAYQIDPEKRYSKERNKNTTSVVC